MHSIRTNADGSIVAIADATNFQTIVMQPTSTEPVFLPDQPVAVGAELVATSQVVGTQADVSLVALDRSTKVAVPTEIPVGGVFEGDTFVMVAVDGSVVRIDDDGADRVGLVGVPTGAMVGWVQPTYGGRRLAVGGDSFEAVVDLDGEVLFATTFAGTVDALRPGPGWACLPVGGAGGSHSLVDLETGEQLAELTGAEIVGAGDRGCAVLALRDGVAEVITAEAVASLGPVTSALLGPDGRSVLRTTVDGRTELVLLADDLSITDTFDLTGTVAAMGTNPLVAFVESTD